MSVITEFILHAEGTSLANCLLKTQRENLTLLISNYTVHNCNFSDPFLDVTGLKRHSGITIHLKKALGKSKQALSKTEKLSVNLKKALSKSKKALGKTKKKEHSITLK
jgi:hypothetical protein